MTARSIGRGRGVVIECNRCGLTTQTANIVKSTNRDFAARSGWGRGSCPSVRYRKAKVSKAGAVLRPERLGSESTKAHDFCPKCLPLDRAAADAIRQAKNETIAAKAAKHRARDAAMRGKP